MIDAPTFGTILHPATKAKHTLGRVLAVVEELGEPTSHVIGHSRWAHFVVSKQTTQRHAAGEET